MLDVPVYAAGSCAGPNGASIDLRAVRCLGAVDSEDVRLHFASAAVFASTALYEPFGLAVLEAAQSATPLVLSDIATFRELWDGAAIFVEPHDPVALAETLRALLTSAERRARLGELARVRAARFSARAMAAGVLRAYRALGTLPAAAA
jgi:glycosyltransferase involved in cell wall biosynthesis